MQSSRVPRSAPLFSSSRPPFVSKLVPGLFAVSCFGGFPGCERSKGDDGAESVARPATPTAASRVSRDIVHIPVGKFRAGSLPGEPGRRPSRESLLQEVELGPFRIDPLPYPGQSGQPAKTGVTRDEAEALCAGQKGRLCTELEWERACKGPTSATYPNGSAGCAPGGTCASGFDVGELGQLPEWTSSRMDAGAGKDGAAVLRGGPADSSAADRRCARRFSETEIETREIGFRCCYGAPNARHLPEPEMGEAYREVDVSLADLAKLLASDPVTAPLAKDATFFRSPDGARTVFERGPRDAQGFTLTTKPLEWQPERGLKLLVVAGRSGERTSFVAAFHVAGETRVLAASFIMKNEPGPVALAYAPSIRPRLHFSTCWGCPGETGKLLFRPPEEFVMLQP